jgi:hypothetical protein
MTAAGDPTYTFKPSLMGAPCHFALRQDGLQWERGRYSGLVRYDRIRKVRMSFRPVTMQTQRYITEIWSSDNPKLQISSASWRSLIEQERLNSSYIAFVTELHRRLATAGSAAEFSNGMPVVTYWIGVAVFAASLFAIGALTVRAMLLSEWTAAALVGALFLVFAVQLGIYFHRNLPGRYRPDAIPASVLPRA